MEQMPAELADPGGTLTSHQARAVMLRRRAWEATGEVLSAEEAEGWYWADRADREASTAG